MKKKIKEAYKIIKFPVFDDYSVTVVRTSDIQAAMNRRKETKNIELGANTRGMAIHVSDEPRSFIFLEYKPTPMTIAHEAWHVIRRTFDYNGMELENECVAYHLGYLVHQMSGPV